MEDCQEVNVENWELQKKQLFGSLSRFANDGQSQSKLQTIRKNSKNNSFYDLCEIQRKSCDSSFEGEKQQRPNQFTKGFAKIRKLLRIFIIFKKTRLQIGFDKIYSKYKRSKLSLDNVSSRMIARLLVNTRQNICGLDVKKSFLHWYIRANPNLTQKCMLKLLSRLPLRYNNVVYRMKELIFKKPKKTSKIQKLISENSGLKILENFMEQKRKMHNLDFFEILKKKFRKNAKMRDLFSKLVSKCNEQYLGFYFSKLTDILCKERILIGKLIDSQKVKISQSLFIFVEHRTAHERFEKINVFIQMMESLGSKTIVLKQTGLKQIAKIAAQKNKKENILKFFFNSLEKSCFTKTQFCLHKLDEHKIYSEMTQINTEKHLKKTTLKLVETQKSLLFQCWSNLKNFKKHALETERISKNNTINSIVKLMKLVRSQYKTSAHISFGILKEYNASHKNNENIKNQKIKLFLNSLVEKSKVKSQKCIRKIKIITLITKIVIKNIMKIDKKNNENEKKVNSFIADKFLHLKIIDFNFWFEIFC